MAVRVGLVLSGVVVVAGIAYVTYGVSDLPPDLDWIAYWVAIFYGGVALALIWLSVLITVVLAKASRFWRRASEP